MTSGLSGKLNILQESPHDTLPPLALEGPVIGSTQHWVPSRYNVRATAEDGRLVLWNTLSGKITVFRSEDREPVLGLLERKGFEAPKEKVVKYLAERGYLVRKGVDEYRQFQQKFGEAHYRTDALELILMASEDCNFRCKYCYEDFTRGTMLPEVREGVKNLTRARIKKLNRLFISWFGGEPLYGWEAVEDLAPFFVQIAEEHNVPFGSNMTTNGYLMTPDIQDKLLEWKIRDFQITLDGLPEHHNHSRAGRDGSPTFERILANLQALASRPDNFRVQLRVNFDQINAAGLSEFIDLMSESFAGDQRFNLALRAVGKWGGSNDGNLSVCGTDEVKRLTQDILAQAKRQGLHFATLRDAAKIGNAVCYAARPYNYLIGATGKVMKCTIVLDKQDYNVVGNLFPDGTLELDADRMALWTEPAYEQDQQCRKCVVLPNCQGISCPLIRMENHTQPCIPARSNPKGELLGILEAPALKKRQISVR
jgi:uncharacterized protein